MALTIDEDDPCSAAKSLRQVYLNLVAGQAAMQVRFKAGSSGVERDVTFNKADPARLLQLIRGFEAKCAASQGKRPRRFAIRAGGVW